MTQIVPVPSVTPQFIAQLNDNFKALSGAISSVPVDVASFGATGDGVTNDLAAFNAAVSSVAAAGGGTLRVGAGTFRLDGQVLWKNGVFLEGAGKRATILDFSQKSTFSYSEGMILAADGGVSNTVSVTTSVAAGAIAIPVSSIAGFAPNDYIMIRSTEVLWSEATVGEMAHVHWADSGFIYLKHPLSFAYNTGGYTVEVVKVSTHTGGIKGLTIKGKGINPAGLPSPTYTGTPSGSLLSSQRGDLGIEVRWGLGWKVEDVRLVGVEGMAIRLHTSIGTRVANNDIDFDSINQLNQYGVSIFSACLDTIVSGNRFTNGRHHVTTNTSAAVSSSYPYVRGLPVGVVIDGNTHTGSWLYPIDTHRGGSGVVISNNAISSLSGGIECRTPHSTIIGNTIRLPIPNSAIPGISAAHGIACYYNNQSISIIGNGVEGGNLGIYVASPNAGTKARVTITGNDVARTSDAAVRVDDAEGVTIAGNNLGPVGAVTSVVRLQNVEDATVNGNVVRADRASGVQYGVYAGATVSGGTTRLVVTANTVLNAESGATVYGVGFDNNVTYSTVGLNGTASCDTGVILGSGTGNVDTDAVASSYGGLKTIASGSITVTSPIRAAVVYPEGGAGTDDLTDITNGADGQILTLRGNDDSHVVTFKDGGGNLRLAGDFATTSSSSTITLVCIANVWYEVARSVNA